jgi:opacity protein-like surface antigen
MKSFYALAAVVACLLVNPTAARSQSQTTDDPPRLEAGVHFSALTLTPSNGYRTEIGFGGRFTVNLNDHLAVEAETTYFPNSGRSAESRASGRAVQGLFGVKAGRRWEKFGLFAKARPGLISFNRGRLVLDPAQTTPPFPVFREERATHFAADVGGVLELYVTRRWMARFDVGDTVIRYGEQNVQTLLTPPSPFTIPKELRHNLQVNAGIGYRFD